jgi:hypothetical protein
VVYVFNPFLHGFVNVSGRQIGEIVLTVLLVLTLLSVVATMAAFTRIRKRVAVIQARAESASVIARDTRSDRLIDWLAPDPVMINSFPRIA